MHGLKKSNEEKSMVYDLKIFCYVYNRLCFKSYQWKSRISYGIQLTNCMLQVQRTLPSQHASQSSSVIPEAVKVLCTECSKTQTTKGSEEKVLFTKEKQDS